MLARPWGRGPVRSHGRPAGPGRAPSSWPTRVERIRGSSEVPAGAAHPDRARVRKAKPSASACARRRARIRGCHRARTASSIAPPATGPASAALRASVSPTAARCAATRPARRPPSGRNAGASPAETADGPRCLRERAGCATRAPAPARSLPRPPLQAGSEISRTAPADIGYRARGEYRRQGLLEVATPTACPASAAAGQSLGGGEPYPQVCRAFGSRWPSPGRGSAVRAGHR